MIVKSCRIQALRSNLILRIPVQKCNICFNAIYCTALHYTELRTAHTILQCTALPQHPNTLLCMAPYYNKCQNLKPSWFQAKIIHAKNCVNFVKFKLSKLV